jgi:hypothetical protein
VRQHHRRDLASEEAASALGGDRHRGNLARPAGYGLEEEGDVIVVAGEIDFRSADAAWTSVRSLRAPAGNFSWGGRLQVSDTHDSRD